MNETFNLFLRISTNRMCEHYLPKLVKSLEILKHKDLWTHESEHLNSIGGIESYFPDEDMEPSELIA